MRKASKYNYDIFLEDAYTAVKNQKLSEVEISTLLNVNREIHSSNKNFISALKELLLPSKEALNFDEMPDAA